MNNEQSTFQSYYVIIYWCIQSIECTKKMKKIEKMKYSGNEIYIISNDSFRWIKKPINVKHIVYGTLWINQWKYHCHHDSWQCHVREREHNQPPKMIKCEKSLRHSKARENKNNSIHHHWHLDTLEYLEYFTVNTENFIRPRYVLPDDRHNLIGWWVNVNVNVNGNCYGKDRNSNELKIPDSGKITLKSNTHRSRPVRFFETDLRAH